MPGTLAGKYSAALGTTHLTSPLSSDAATCGCAPSGVTLIFSPTDLAPMALWNWRAKRCSSSLHCGIPTALILDWRTSAIDLRLSWGHAVVFQARRADEGKRLVAPGAGEIAIPRLALPTEREHVQQVRARTPDAVVARGTQVG